MADQAEMIGKQFAQHYYNTFKTDRAGLGRLYQADSILCWEGKRFVGQQEIHNHMAGLPFEQIDFKFSTLDCQPTGGSQGVLVFVTGQLMTSGESKPLQFSQVFHLVNANGAWMLSNDMFRLNYG